MNPPKKDQTRLAVWILTLGLVFVFGYAAISSLQNPEAWIGFLPNFMTKHVDAHTLLKIFAIYELILAAWLLSRRFARYCALLCAATLAGIVVCNPLGALLITFRDVGLAAMAFALALLNNK
jgi:hypothetical protein